MPSGAVSSSSGSQKWSDLQNTVAAAGDSSGRGQGIAATHWLAATAPCLLLKELHRARVDHHRAEKSLILQAKAQLRRMNGGEKEAAAGEFDALLKQWKKDRAPTVRLWQWMQAIELFRAGRTGYEKRMAEAVKALPVWEWAEGIKGFGALGLAQIVGECGDLGMYSNPAKVWKRMGLALIGGERQRKCADPEKALAHGYSPDRRAIMFCIGDSLVKCSKGPMRKVYDARKAFEIEKAKAEGLKVAPASKIPKGKAAEYRSAGHIHKRAQRYMEKRLLRDLWRAWRDANKKQEAA